jgi:hypothetical protein
VDQPSKDAFLELCSTARYKEAWMADHVKVSNGNLQWDILFTRQVLDWEVDLVTSFFDLLYSIRLRHGGGDKICWI